MGALIRISLQSQGEYGKAISLLYEGVKPGMLIRVFRERDLAVTEKENENCQ